MNSRGESLDVHVGFVVVVDYYFDDLSAADGWTDPRRAGWTLWKPPLPVQPRLATVGSS